MAPHFSTLAWKIPWMEEPGGLPSVGSLRVRHDWATSLSLFTFHFHALEKEMATHSSVLAWRIPGMAEPDGLPSMGSHRVGHDWNDLAAAAAYIYPLPLELPSHLPPHLGWYRAPVWVSLAVQQIPAGYFTYGNVSFHVTLSLYITLSSHFPVSTRLLSMSVSPSLPCK